uniref:Unplaced genomic scaffold supercont1.16, whole genome shotgun sequence n=1 Tax=Cryptococcus bacillisporus CA1280 TaxID=1296109 RepID=A0A0D0TG88_CRYGA|nr:mitochondrial import inner membrane translocase subunit TIM8 [Cryptococcus bacillisporus CA1280]
MDLVQFGGSSGGSVMPQICPRHSSAISDGDRRRQISRRPSLLVVRLLTSTLQVYLYISTLQNYIYIYKTISQMSAPTAIPALDEASKKELESFLEQEQAKAKLQASIHELTNTCWNTCITGSISSKFSKSEAQCLENCVDRFLDSSLYIVRQIEAQKQQI